MTLENLALSVDSWQFLNSDSPKEINPFLSKQPTFQTLPDSSLLFEVQRLRSVLQEERLIRNKAIERIAELEHSLAKFNETGFVLESASVELEGLRHVLNKLGKIAINALKHDDTAVAEVINLCGTVGVSVGSYLEISSWNSLPRVKVFQDEIGLTFKLFNTHGILFSVGPFRSSQNERPIQIPLPSKDSIILKIFCDNLLVAETQILDFTNLSNKLFRAGVPLHESTLELKFIQ